LAVVAANPPIIDPSESARLRRRDQMMVDLGWDDESSERMAQARHQADPERYPTLESARYTDPEPLLLGPDRTTIEPPQDVPAPESRSDKLAEQDRLWRVWAETATTDTVPDRYVGEPMPDGTLATTYWWYHPDGALRDKPPDADDGPGREFIAAPR
jgi:hypothetical protein